MFSGKFKLLKEGERFNKWTVLRFDQCKGKGGNAYWFCKCECGNEGSIPASHLRNGGSKQCKSCQSRDRQRLSKVERKHLYMIKCGSYIKIGSTDDIKVRMISLKSYNPYPIKLIGYWPDYGYKEKEWQNYMMDTNIHGEWFELKDEI